MNPTLQNVFIEEIKKANDSISNGIDLAMKQVPDLVRQILLWNEAKDILLLLLGVSIFILTLFFVKKIKANFKPSEDRTFAIVLIYTTGSIFGFGFFFSNLLEIIQILVAPKVFLLNYITSLLHHH